MNINKVWQNVPFSHPPLYVTYIYNDKINVIFLWLEQVKDYQQRNPISFFSQILLTVLCPLTLSPKNQYSYTFFSNKAVQAIFCVLHTSYGPKTHHITPYTHPHTLPFSKPCLQSLICTLIKQLYNFRLPCSLASYIFYLSSVSIIIGITEDLLFSLDLCIHDTFYAQSYINMPVLRLWAIKFRIQVSEWS